MIRCDKIITKLPEAFKIISRTPEASKHIFSSARDLQEFITNVRYLYDQFQMARNLKILQEPWGSSVTNQISKLCMKKMKTVTNQEARRRW